MQIWHNPRCSKSREALGLLEDKGVEIFRYLDETITKDEIKSLLKKLNIAPRELMRTKEEIYKELDLKNETDDEVLVEMMAKHPRLIERPIVIDGDYAFIGRPVERVVEYIKK